MRQTQLPAAAHGEEPAMTVKECYETLGGDYAGVVARFRGEALVKRFALRFLDDGSYNLLQESLANGDYETAFRAAHTIKGVCQNLGFTRLYGSSSALTEALRGGWSDEAASLVAPVEHDYRITVDAIEALRAAQG